MSAVGHEQTSRHVHVMSVIPLKADIHQRGLHVRLVPLADIKVATSGSLNKGTGFRAQIPMGFTIPAFDLG